MKPLGHKAYGSIPHFFNSRVGPADKHCDAGMQKIMTEKCRDRHDLIIVQEKLDGSNVAIAKVNGEILALTRSGYLASTSPYTQHHNFAVWVGLEQFKFNSVLNEGERIVGEWLYQAHGTRYNLPHDLFVPFDIMTEHTRINYHDFLLRVLPHGLPIPRLIHIGQPFRLKNAIEAIKTSGHGAVDPVEGVVYRCERHRKVDFLCKYVRPDKVDGLYLPEISGKEAVYNTQPIKT